MHTIRVILVICAYLLATTSGQQRNSTLPGSTAAITTQRRPSAPIGLNSSDATRSGRFFTDDDNQDDFADANYADDDAVPAGRALNATATATTAATNSTGTPEGRSFFDDLDISPLGGYKKYSKAYINMPGYQASKEKVEGGGLMPSPVPVPGMVNVPYITAPGGGEAPLLGPIPVGGPVGYPVSGGYPFNNGQTPYSHNDGPVPYDNNGPVPYNSNNGFYPMATYNVGPSPYMNNGPPAPYGPYPSSGNYGPARPLQPQPVNAYVAPPAVVVQPQPHPIIPVGNPELSNFITAIRHPPQGPPPGIIGRPLPSHCTCKRLADCRDVSRFARMYTDDDAAYNGQCLPSFVVCCNPELLQQQLQAARPPSPPASGVIVPVGVPVYSGGPGGPVAPPPPPPIVPAPPACGRKGKNPLARVLDDHAQRSEAEFGEYPWMAAVLLSDLTYVCGGALISDKFVLTAAHCISKHKNRNLIVRLGEYDVMESSEPPFHDYKVVEAIIHAGFHSGTLRNDIAILVLDVPAKFNAYIAPVCLPQPGASYGPSLCTVTGWGKDSPGKGKWSSVLKEVNVPLVTNEFCENSYRKSPELAGYFNLDSSFVCAGAPGKDACYGDGGSPLVCPINGVYQLVGLVSWGIDCGLYPGVYARVDKFLPWITDVTRQYS